MLEYRSVSDLNASVRQWAHEGAVDVDLVVGIPRSGLLAANLLCLHLNCSMTDVEGLCEGELLATGRRYDGAVSSVSDADRVLVVDDSVNTGHQMTEIKRRLDGFDFPFDVEYGAVYVSPDGEQHVDHWQEVVNVPRVFEWNLLHHPGMRSWCVDIDGVLCRDPIDAENDDGENYREFVTGVEPNVVPTKPIGSLVTCRLEKYRPETERWLDEHGFEYDELVMMDLPSMEARREAGTHAKYKAEVYASRDADLFIESAAHQAWEIAERTGKPVYCFEQNRMIQPTMLDRVYRRGTSYLSKFVNDPVSFSLKAGKFVAQRGRRRPNPATRRY